MTSDLLRVVIVDDEPLARAVVREFLGAHPGVEVVAECANGFEAVKAVSELFAPMTGEVIEVNDHLKQHPEVVNSDPHGTWMIKVKLAQPTNSGALLDSSQYQSLLG